MKRLDKILEFLLRTRLGNFVLVVAIGSAIALFSGCVGTDCLLYGCEKWCGWGRLNCECSYNCIEGCDYTGDSIGNCIFPHTKFADCMFNDGCVSECGTCTVEYGGCNRTMCIDSGTCKNAADGCHVWNCTCYPKANSTTAGEAMDVKLYYRNEKQEKEDLSRNVGVSFVHYENRQRISSIPIDYSKFSTDFFRFDGFFLDKEFTQRCTDSNGKWLKADINDAHRGTEYDNEDHPVEYRLLWGKLVEKYAGQAFVLELYDPIADDTITFGVVCGTRMSGWAVPEHEGLTYNGVRVKKDNSRLIVSSASVFHVDEWLNSSAEIEQDENGKYTVIRAELEYI